jgi:hypothetical protein
MTKSKKSKEPNTDEPDFIYDLIREDGRLERTCPHGIGHTVGHLNREELNDEHMWIHGCDGCCKNYKRMGGKNR